MNISRVNDRGTTQPSRLAGSLADGEELLTVSQLRALPALRNLGRGGRRPELSFIIRLMSQGKVTAAGERIRLEHVRLGSRYLSSKAAVDRFIAALASTSPAPLAEHDAAALAHARAEARLSAMGI